MIVDIFGLFLIGKISCFYFIVFSDVVFSFVIDGGSFGLGVLMFLEFEYIDGKEYYFEGV